VPLYFMYVNNKLMYEASSSGSKEYIYLGSNLAATRSTSSAGTSFQYHHFNPIASTIAVSNQAGVAVQERYNSFGSSLVPNATFKATTNVRFAGHYSDDEADLIYMGARYYNPRIGRFISPDPARFSEKDLRSFNKYSYANNNPQKFIDPDGRVVPLILGGAMLVADMAGAALAVHDIYKGNYVSGAIELGLSAAGFGVLKSMSTAAKLVKDAATGAKESQAARAAADSMVDVYHGSPKSGLTEIVPQGGGTSRQEVARDVLKEFAPKSKELAQSEAIVAGEKGKTFWTTDKAMAEKYAGPNGSVYSAKLPEKNLGKASDLPSDGLTRGSAEFYFEGVVKGVQETRMNGW
jgi:RHS repeat-associated protein